MEPFIAGYLDDVLAACADDRSGHLADYIPELTQVDPDRFGVALSTVEGQTYAAGDADTEFTIQSVSKAFVYAMAIAEFGLAGVLEKVGVEPSGEAFNELSLERESRRPLNPMINAGAITVHSMLGGAGADAPDRGAMVLDWMSRLAGRQLHIDQEVYESELNASHRNLSIAHMLRSYRIIEDDPEDVVDGYVRQCAIVVTPRDLAIMAATVANGGTQPCTGERLFTGRVARQLLSVMTTCGMYNAAGDWVSNVGIPAKSGVSGGIIGALPGQMGIATLSPRVDERGNSVRGVQVFERLSDEMDLHLMEVPAPARSVLRTRDQVTGPDGGVVPVYELHGALQFANTERVVRALTDQPPDARRVIVDLSLVHSVNDIARRMLTDLLANLARNAVDVHLVDPERVLDRLEDHS